MQLCMQYDVLWDALFFCFIHSLALSNVVVINARKKRNEKEKKRTIFWKI